MDEIQSFFQEARSLSKIISKGWRRHRLEVELNQKPANKSKALIYNATVNFSLIDEFGKLVKFDAILIFENGMSEVNDLKRWLTDFCREINEDLV